jgi:hypothetical protein
MRHQSLRSPLLLLCATLSWSLVSLSSCRDEIIGPPTHDTLVVIDTGHPHATVEGKVTIMDRCLPSQTQGGILVEVPELGLSAVTDANGNFKFDTLPLRSLRFVCSHEGTYTATVINFPMSLLDGRFVLPTISLHQPNNYSGRLVGDAIFKRFYVKVYRDSIYQGADGDWYTTKVFADSVEDGQVTFQAECLDENNKVYTGTPILYVSRIKQIDPTDSTTYLFTVRGSALAIKRKVAKQYGIEPYEAIYVAASSACSPYAPSGNRCSASWGIQAP